MPRILLALATVAALAVAAPPCFADRPGTPAAPRSYQTPTDEYVPPARPAAPAHRARRAPGGGLTAYVRSLPTYAPPPYLGALRPASGPSYFQAPTASTYYYVPYPPAAPRYALEPAYPPVPPGIFTRQDYDGAPCPTRSRTSLGELFACTR